MLTQMLKESMEHEEKSCAIHSSMGHCSKQLMVCALCVELQPGQALCGISRQICHGNTICNYPKEEGLRDQQHERIRQARYLAGPGETDRYSGVVVGVGCDAVVR